MIWSSLSSHLYAVISYLIIGYIHISSLSTCFLSSHHSYQFISLLRNPFNSFRDFPRPPLACSPSSADLGLVPPPPGVGGAGGDDNGVAGVND